MSTIRDEIKQSYLNEGGLQENLTNQSQTIAGIIKAKNNIAVNSISNVTVTPKKGTDTIYEHTVSDLQENVTIKDGKFFGTLKYVSEGALPTQWGAGYFLAVDYADENDTGATYKTGLNP